MQNYIQRGEVMTFIAAADVNGGDLVKVGELVGVVAYSAKAGEESEASLKGVYEVPKAAGALSQGAKLYFSDANDNVSGTNTDTFAGYAFKSALAGDATVQILLAH